MNGVALCCSGKFLVLSLLVGCLVLIQDRVLRVQFFIFMEYVCLVFIFFPRLHRNFRFLFQTIFFHDMAYFTIHTYFYKRSSCKSQYYLLNFTQIKQQYTYHSNVETQLLQTTTHISVIIPPLLILLQENNRPITFQLPYKSH